MNQVETYSSADEILIIHGRHTPVIIPDLIFTN